MEEDPAVQVDEAELVVRIMYQEGEAFRTFAKLYGPKVLGWLIKRHGPEVAEVAFNQALMKVWEKAETYAPDKGILGAWFLRIAQNTANDILRGEKAYRQQHCRLDPDYDPAAPATERSGENDPEDALRRERRLDDFHEVLDGLPPLQRAVIQADLAEGKAAEAKLLARRLGTSANAIRVHRSNARKTICHEMTKRGHNG